MLMEGECAAYAALVGGDERRVRKLFPGDHFAEASLARLGLDYEHTVRAGANGAELARLRAEDFSAAFGRSATRAAADAFVAEMAAAASRGVLGLVDDAVADEMAGIGEPGVAARPRTPPTPSPRRRGRDESATEWLAKEANARESSPPPPDPKPPPLVVRPRRRPRMRTRDRNAPVHPLEWETDSEAERARETDPNAETPREDFEDVGEDVGVDRRRARGSDPTRGRRPKPPLGPPPRETRVSRVSWRVSRRTRCSKARNVARFAPPSPRWNCASCLRAARYFARANAAIICTSSKPASWTSPRRIPREVPRAARRARGVDRSWVTWR